MLIILPLKGIYDSLNNPANVKYLPNGSYPIQTRKGHEYKKSKELLEISCGKSREYIFIASFDNESTRVMYVGENAKDMMQTLQKLRIPKTPSNIGEIVFRMFRQKLEQMGEEPVSLEQRIPAGKETQLRHIIKKFIYVYSQQSIDSKFYAASNRTLLG